MEDCLSGISTGVSHDAVPGTGQTFLFCNVGRGDQQLRQEISVLVATVLYRRYMSFRDNKRMDRRLRINIVEGQRVIVFIDDLGGDGFLHDLTKETIGHGMPQDGCRSPDLPYRAPNS